MTQASFDNKSQLLEQFQQVLAERKRQEYRVATKEEEAETQKNRELLEIASTYTPDSIVRGFADLQLEFDTTVTSLADRLETEAKKLDELRKSIEIETETLQQLQKVGIVADALHLLRREHQEQRRALEDKLARQQEALEKERTQTRKAWEKERQAFETQVAETEAMLQKQRQQEAADFQYELQRQRKIDADEYERQRRELEAQLSQQNREKEKDWTEREAFLSDRQEEFDEKKQRVATFEAELQQAFDRAKEETIRKVNREASVKANLVEKEWEGLQQGYEVKISALETTIQRQNEQIAEISAQLQAAAQQSRELAIQAFGNRS
ncbi:hypothetical protein AY599_10815 [Leptolyngbya valderiana BDU 20041]|nr:hypothetical protein [Geitlerinema sp. CS-897]OAB62282.1 hypothetical protein AY599_10815 [Leptolyngbya valderiana BDU 20041]PPT10265.1 Myosin heavy chain [Geitlerinema sp. FC II]